MSKSSNGKRLKRIFDKRFGDRITVVYADKPSSKIDCRMHNEQISSALIDVLTGILGRAPTRRELLGIDELSVE